MARAGRSDHAIKFVLFHLVAQRGIAASIFLGGERLVDYVAVIGRATHIGKGQSLVELVANGFPGLRADGSAGVRVFMGVPPRIVENYGAPLQLLRVVIVVGDYI